MARNDMFSWLLGQKKRAEEPTAVPEAAVKPEAAPALEAVPEPEVATAAEMTPARLPETNLEANAEVDPAKHAAAAATAAAAAAAAAARLEPPPAEEVAQPSVSDTSENVAAASQPAGTDENAPSAVIVPTAEPAPLPTGILEAGAGTEPEAPANGESDTTGIAQSGGRPVLGVSKTRTKPAAGMSATLFAGRKLQPVKIEEVSASGRRIVVTSPGSNLRRPYTLRRDGSYRLEGAPDGAGPFIEIS